MADISIKSTKPTYAAQLAVRKGLATAFEFELFRLDALWEEFADSETEDELETALEAVIRYEIVLVEKIQQAVDKNKAAPDY